ncbi:MAG: DUF1573 domain-containing protein [Chlorobi bacterium]|nr:DUF1573 domain-containing protein [Chlorobiota bacterium]
MKKLYVYLTGILFFLFAYNGLSQQKGASIAFESKVHDFGRIKEVAGRVTHDFKFKNTGDQPLVITRVTASCGCTTPTWSKEPIPPGGDGFIRVVYNPKNRPNAFNKSITIYSNANQGNVLLRITGFVEPRPKTLEDTYPYQIGGLRFKKNHIAFTRIYKGQKKTQLDEFINTSDEPITIEFTRVPPHVTMKADPQTVKPKEKGTVTVTYDASKKNDWGFAVDRAWVKLNGTELPSARLTISASIQEDFSKLTPEQKSNAAHIQFKEKVYDFGTMEQKTTVEHEFVFTNTGKSDLVIHKVRSSCGCTVVSPKENVIKPGQSSFVKAIFNSGTRVGRQNKSITVITNDPNMPTTVLRITGIVNAPGKK